MKEICLILISYMKSKLKENAHMHALSTGFLTYPNYLHFIFIRSLFDQMIVMSKKDRPFYEFGVLEGTFKYLIKTFKKGYGFDTFEGLPEDWHNEKAAPTLVRVIFQKLLGGNS